MIDAITTLGKVNVLGAAALNIVVTSLSPKPFNITGFYLVADGLVDNPNTYIKDSDFVMVEFLNVF